MSDKLKIRVIKEIDFEHIRAGEYHKLSDAYVERMQKCYPKLDISQMIYGEVK